MDVQVERYMHKAYHNGQHLMTLLPRHNDLGWGQHTQDDPQIAVTICTRKDKKKKGKREICAAMTPQRQTNVVTFMIETPATQNKPGYWTPMNYEDIIKTKKSVTMTFESPFKQLIESGKASRSRTVAVVRWYFFARDLLEHQDNDQLKAFYSSFYEALLLIEKGMGEKAEARETGSTDVQDPIAQYTDSINKDDAPQDQEEEDNQEAPQNQGEANNHEASVTQNLVNQDHEDEDHQEASVLQDVVHEDQEDAISHEASVLKDDADHRQRQTPVPDKVVEDTEEKDFYRTGVENKDLDGVFNHPAIPHSNEVRFIPQRYSGRYARSKLYIGYRLQDGACAYAYLYANSQKIRFDVEMYETVTFKIESGGSNAPEWLKSHMLGGLRYKLDSPFNLVYQEPKETLENIEVFRLKIMVVWYFMMEGITMELGLSDGYMQKRRENYLRDLLATLEFIGKRLPHQNELPVRHSPRNATASHSLSITSILNASMASDAQLTLESMDETVVNGNQSPTITSTAPSSHDPSHESRTTPSTDSSSTDEMSIHKDPTVTSPLPASSQSALNSPVVSSMPPPNVTNSTVSTQTRNIMTPAATAAASTSKSASLASQQSGRRKATAPKASAPIFKQIGPYSTASTSGSGSLSTSGSLAATAQRPLSSTPTPSVRNDAVPLNVVNLTNNPSLSNSSAPDYSAARGTKRARSEDIYEQYDRAQEDQKNARQDYDKILIEVAESDVKKRAWDTERSKIRSDTHEKHVAEYCAKEKEHNAEIEKTRREMEAEIKKKVKEMETRNERIIAEKQASMRAELTRMKDTETKAMDDLEREGRKWEDDWGMQRNDLQSRQRKSRRKERAAFRMIKDLASRLGQDDEDTDEDT